MFSQQTRRWVQRAMEPRGHIALWFGTTIAFVAVISIALLMTSTSGADSGPQDMLSAEAATGQHAETITR